jgi:hypothetical protein
MPGYDKTGPAGQGPMTGGARGYCAGPAAAPLGAARGLGRGGGPCGRGRCFGRAFHAGRTIPESPVDTKPAVEKRIETLQSEINRLQAWIDQPPPETAEE